MQVGRIVWLVSAQEMWAKVTYVTFCLGYISCESSRQFPYHNMEAAWITKFPWRTVSWVLNLNWWRCSMSMCMVLFLGSVVFLWSFTYLCARTTLSWWLPLYAVLKLERVSPSTLLFFFRIVVAILGSLSFHMNFRVTLKVSTNFQDIGFDF